MKNSTWLKFMNFGKYIGCHQLAERSFFYKNYQFPVCARCTGVIISAVIAAPMFLFWKMNIYYAVAMSAVMLLDWLIQHVGIKQSTNRRRLITGLIGGFGWTTIHMYCYYWIFKIVTTYIL